jgi:pyruvate/2-oxoglutarate dehydrogenase complex dihydrolipoamide dehydrogenase (E3) component
MRYEYDMVVVGGGAAGLTGSGLAASFGAKTLLVEQDRLGGDCTWTGCIPSKTLLRVAASVHEVKRAQQWGVRVSEVEIDFRAVMEHVRSVRQSVYDDADDPRHFERIGVEVVQGQASFIDPHRLRVMSEGGERTVSARYVLLATGAQPRVPDIEGLSGVPFLTNETLFEISDLPSRLLILGAGPIGAEMAQAFARLGTTTTVIDPAKRILSREDPELASTVQNALEAEGVTFYLGEGAERVRLDGDEIVTMTGERELRADALLVATGRKANLDSLNLENAGLALDGGEGLQVDARCRTAVRHIYGAGDATQYPQLTHMAEHMAKVAMTNAILKIPQKIDRARLNWCTFTDPELAHVGATQRELDENGTSYEVHRLPYEKIDRAVADAAQVGTIKVYATKWTGRILGVSIVGAQAGELIGEWSLALRNGVPLREISDTIHPYPTYALGNRRTADLWYLERRPMWLLRLIRRLLGYQGEVPTTEQLKEMMA